jgi:ornithine decarboxylase
MLHASTSPFYPLFAALDVNAKMHEGKSGQRLWKECVRVGIEARKMLLETCQLIKPFVPDQIDGKPWQSYDTETMANDLRFFNFVPSEKWHAFEGYAESQYFVDPVQAVAHHAGHRHDER